MGWNPPGRQETISAAVNEIGMEKIIAAGTLTRFAKDLLARPVPLKSKRTQKGPFAGASLSKAQD